MNNLFFFYERAVAALFMLAVAGAIAGLVWLLGG